MVEILAGLVVVAIAAYAFLYELPRTFYEGWLQRNGYISTDKCGRVISSKPVPVSKVPVRYLLVSRFHVPQQKVRPKVNDVKPAS